MKKKKPSNKAIKVFLRHGDDTRVRVIFNGDELFTPAEFTSMFMAVLETYTKTLLTCNTREQIFEHFNNVFGIFLNKLVPPKEHYELSKDHKDFKKAVDSTLGRKETDKDKQDTQDNRFAAYLITRDILINEVGLTEDAADVILNKRLNLLQTPTKEGLSNETSKESRKTTTETKTSKRSSTKRTRV